jgi:hypothetical protein
LIDAVVVDILWNATGCNEYRRAFSKDYPARMVDLQSLTTTQLHPEDNAGPSFEPSARDGVDVVGGHDDSSGVMGAVIA